MGSKHSPGPWAYQATAGDHDFAVYSESESSGRDIALVRDFDEANAKLIAAAPELLAALQRIDSINGSTGGPAALVKEFKIIAALAIAKVVD